MEVEIPRGSGGKIVALLLVITMISTMTSCWVESVGVYDDGYVDEDNDRDMELVIGDEDDDKAFSFPMIAETESYTTMERTSHRSIKCNEDQIMKYLAELQVTNPESILLIASYKDLEHLCRRIAGNLDSIDAYMQTCVPLSQDHLYMQLIAGLRILSNKLCLESEYQRSFRQYLSCFHELHNEYIDCAGPADWTENMEQNELCNQYKIIADCYYMKTAMLCGVQAAKTMKELVVRVINAIIDVSVANIAIHCPQLRKNPVVPDPMPEFVYSRASTSWSLKPNSHLSLTLVAVSIVTSLPVNQI